MLAYFLMIVAVFAFLSHAIFALATRQNVRPEHDTAQILTVIIAVVAGFSYFLIQSSYRSVLAEAATLSDPNERVTLLREAYTAVGQYRYMDWTITTPLLLIKMVQALGIRPGQIKRLFTWMLVADVFMIVTGYIGEQQLSFDNEPLVAPKLIWGAVSTLGYVIVVWVLYRVWKEFADRARPEERAAYRLMALTTVTFWGVYPIGYILSAFGFDPSWLHIAFSVADIVNKVGVGLVAYQASLKSQVVG